MDNPNPTQDREAFMRDYLESITGHIFSGESIGNVPRTVTVYVRKGDNAYMETRPVIQDLPFTPEFCWKMAVE